MSDTVKFSSLEEEAQYYKILARDLQERLQDTQQELEEFQINSKDLESELETQLEQEEKNSRELRTVNNRLTKECETLREKLEKVHLDSSKQIRELQDELCREKSKREDLQKYVRELEQINDDLERAKRATLSSVEDFETRLNQAIERNAFLENELDDKESLTFMVQRFKDEARDLKQELLIQQAQNKSAHIPNNDKAAEKILEITPDKLSPGNDTSTPTRNYFANHTPLTPSARISALNIVGDLLRRVGALETKLASCRNYVKESPQKLEEPTSPVKTPTSDNRRIKRSSLSLSKDGISLIA